MSEPIRRRRRIGTVTIIEGDCLEVLPTLTDRCTACLTDPPYGLTSSPSYLGEEGGGGGGFMGAKWDHGVPGIPYWQAVRAACAPGAYLLAFGGTRTYHRQTCAIEDSGWIIRDCLMWIYGSGFPKSLDLSKSIDKSLGVERDNLTIAGKSGKRRSCMSGDYQGEYFNSKPATPQSKLWDGYGTAIKPAYEPVVLAMNPRDGSFVNNALEHGCGGLNIDGTRIESHGEHARPFQPSNNRNSMFAGCKPFQPSNSTQGRWPANILIDDSPEVVGLFPSVRSGGQAGLVYRTESSQHVFSSGLNCRSSAAYSDKGSAARFFYCAKAPRTEREAGCQDLDPITRADATGRKEGSAGLDNPRAMQRSTSPIRNNHPTVKPLALMRYLLRLITQPAHNHIIDPFAGSGTTGVAAALAGLECTLIELEPRHFDICCARVEWALRVRDRLGGVEPPLDLTPYTRPAAAAASGEAQLNLWGK